MGEDCSSLMEKDYSNISHDAFSLDDDSLLANVKCDSLDGAEKRELQEETSGQFSIRFFFTSFHNLSVYYESKKE